MTLSLKLWGVRGSTPTPGPSTLRYGGETTSFEIRAGGDIVLIDCGSGARNLGSELHAGPPRAFDMFFTHTHLDHICGLPFFTPAYDDPLRHQGLGRAPDRQLRPDGHHLPDHVAADLSGRRQQPARRVLRHFRPGGPLERTGEIALSTVALNHPGGATGYRLEHGGKSICIITDHEHGDPEIDRAVRRFVEGADVMIYDAMFTDEEYPRFTGWGHSTWQKGVELALEAGVARPVLFHHDPRRDDDALDAIAEQAAADIPGHWSAREGMVLTP